jgi:P-type E1-E2 ATPase
VLVVATPCPLILSIPVAILGAVSLAAKQGIVIRNAAILEQINSCKTLILDKTGTLTMGEPELSQLVLLGQQTEIELLALVGSLEQYSRHPLSRAVMRRVNQSSIPLKPVTKLSEQPGTGLSGWIEGNEIFVTGRKHPLVDPTLVKATEHTGLECFVLINNKLSGYLRFRDTIRPESQNFIEHLKGLHNFSKIMIVSGDRHSEVSYLAELLKIDHIKAEVAPEEKLAIVNQELSQQKVVFLGDGINDAPALVAATVGIAFGAVNEVTTSAADAVLINPSLQGFDRLIHLSSITHKIILQSALGGTLASAIAMTLAAFGWFSPTAGAIIQEIIDLIAVGNALRITFLDQELSDLS